MNHVTETFNKMKSHSLGLLVLRLAMGVIFIYAGYMKLANMEMTLGFFASVGIGAFLTYAVSIIELLGGISLIVGYFARYFSFALAIIIIFAIILVKWNMGFAQIQSDILLFAGLVTILLSGCGRYSLCGMMHRKTCETCSADGRCGCQHN